MDTRDAILERAEALFARRGFAGFSISEIAGDLGLSKSTIFHHFPSKKELYLCLLESLFERLWNYAESSVDDEDAPLERLIQLMLAIIDFLGRNPNTAKLFVRIIVEYEDGSLGINRDEMFDRYGANVTRLVNHIIGLLRSGMDRGEIRPASVGELTQTLIGSVVFHYSSGEFGNHVTGSDIFSQERIKARKSHTEDLIRRYLAV